MCTNTRGCKNNKYNEACLPKQGANVDIWEWAARGHNMAEACNETNGPVEHGDTSNSR